MCVRELIFAVCASDFALSASSILFPQCGFMLEQGMCFREWECCRMCIRLRPLCLLHLASTSWQLSAASPQVDFQALLMCAAGEVRTLRAGTRNAADPAAAAERALRQTSAAGTITAPALSAALDRFLAYQRERLAHLQGGQGPVVERQMGEVLRGVQAVAAQLSQSLAERPRPRMWSPALESRLEALASNLSSMTAGLGELEHVARQLHIEAAPELAGIVAAATEEQAVSACDETWFGANALVVS